jgi:hypothetical protein
VKIHFNIASGRHGQLNKGAYLHGYGGRHSPLALRTSVAGWGAAWGEDMRHHIHKREKINRQPRSQSRT